MFINIFFTKFFTRSESIWYLLPMKLSEYLRKTTPAGRKTLASTAGITVAYLYQLAGGHRHPSASTARRIEEGTNGVVKRMALLYPDEA